MSESLVDAMLQCKFRTWANANFSQKLNGAKTKSNMYIEIMLENWRRSRCRLRVKVDCNQMARGSYALQMRKLWLQVMEQAL